MYRLILESLLGLSLDVDKLHFAPCLPEHWREFKLHYRYRETVYHIVVTQTPAVDAAQRDPLRVTVDGVARLDNIIPLIDDRQEHVAEVSITATAVVPQRDLKELAGF